MKKIMLVGQFDSIVQSIYKVLAKQFYIQLCPDDAKVMGGMLKIFFPDLIIVSTAGMTESNSDIFEALTKLSPSAKTICVGSPEEYFLLDLLLPESHYIRLQRPITIRQIAEKIYEVLKITPEEARTGKPAKRTIMLIDDNAVHLRAINDLIKGSYNVLMATSGAEALKIMGTYIPDLIFLDYDMPDCDGRMTLEMIRENKPSHDVPVVFLTGVSDRNKIMAVMDLCPADYILKPVTQQKILDTIVAVLGD